MMNNNEIRLTGEAAVSFHNMMTSVDLDAINARDEFLTDVNFKIDDMGILSIDISDMELDLSVLDDVPAPIGTVITLTRELHVGCSNVSCTFGAFDALNRDDGKSSSYKVSDYYVLPRMYSVNQNGFIPYVA